MIVAKNVASNGFEGVYHALFSAYGPQHWWPADTPFEVMIGAILTQNTAWSNVEKAINNLKSQRLLSPEKIVTAELSAVSEAIRPSGYFNQKAVRLQGFCAWYLAQGSYDSLAMLPVTKLRTMLLSVKGVGPETADDMLLYAFDHPVFVVDAYTRRIFTRLGLLQGGESYEAVRSLFESALPKNTVMMNEYHALIVLHAKLHCKKKPRCDECCIQHCCKVVNSAIA